MARVKFIESPIGKLRISERAGCITGISFDKELTADTEEGDSPLLESAAGQLAEYFAGRRHEFELPLSGGGTPFQQAVWNALREIPYGQTRTYKQIAQSIGRPKACRAVGMANNRNPIAIVVPCHRVIGSNGSLVGYAGGLDIKQRLLAIEKR